MGKITPKQERFCREYVIDLNGTQAARRANIELSETPKRYYVYFLINPVNGRIFYVGKGKGKRMNAHLVEFLNGVFYNSKKADHISEIVNLGHKPTAVIIENDLPESMAFELEREYISRLKEHGICNILNTGQSGGNNCISKSKFLLGKVMPFEKWINIKQRTESEVKMYFDIVKELTKISIEGWENTVTIVH